MEVKTFGQNVSTFCVCFVWKSGVPNGGCATSFIDIDAIARFVYPESCNGCTDCTPISSLDLSNSLALVITLPLSLLFWVMVCSVAPRTSLLFPHPVKKLASLGSGNIVAESAIALFELGVILQIITRPIATPRQKNI